MHICLGTANFKKNYGLNKNKIKKNKALEILKYIKTKKICYLDTAFSYKNYGILNLEKNFKIITKVSKLRDYKKSDIEKNILLQIKPFISNKQNKLYAILLHNCKDMFSSKNYEIFRCLNVLRKNRVTQKIGISCYYENDLSVLKKFKFDIIQFPLNIFDQRILKKKNLEKIKNTELHVRSVFLQGLLLRKINEMPNNLQKWEKIFNKYEEFLNLNSLKKIEASLLFLKQQKIIKKIVIGVDNIKQIDQILKILNSTEYKKVDFKNLKSNDENLILPINWSKY